MDIPNPTPITVPAEAQKVYDKQFCSRLVISADPSEPWSARFIGLPYDGESVLNNGIFQVELKDLKALAAKDTDLAQAMGAVLAVIGKYLVKCKLKNKHEVTIANIEEILK